MRSVCRAVAPLLAVLLAVPLPAQEISIAPVRPRANVLIRPYLPAAVPPVRLANSPRLAELIRGGALYLTAQDAIALALENNIDLEVARYNPLVADWQLERAEAGGALPGVPSGASQAGSVASGQGVLGSQNAAGVGITGAGSAAARNTNATITQIGPVTQNLDPIFQETTAFGHTTTPQPNLVQSQTPALISSTHVYNASYQQGFLTGGVMNVSYSEHYLQENAASDLLNPSVAPNASISVQHNLLRGFGIAVNARTITVSRMNRDTTDLSFKSRVISIVSQVLDQYYRLAASYQDLKAKRNTAQVANAFLSDVDKEIRIGSVAPTDRIGAEEAVVNGNQAVVDSESSLRQQEVSLKNLICRTGILDPLIANVRIVPIDTLSIPPSDNLPPLEQMVAQALDQRADLAAQRANEKASEISSLGTRNGVLPNMQVFAAESHAGLAGVPRTVISNGRPQTADPYFVGGIGTALGEVFRRNFPTERIGMFYQSQVQNRQAQADAAIDQLQLRQTQLNLQKSLSQVEVDIRNGMVALQQARARYDAAMQNVNLERGLFEAEQKRFRLGASTPYLVTRQQRDLITAESQLSSTLVSYVTARIALDQSLGLTLDAYNVSIGDASSGRVSRTSSLPANLPPQP